VVVAAKVDVEYCGVRLPIDTILMLESQNGSTFHTIGIDAPQYATTTIVACGTVLCQ
jgi:hypothetical protein